MEKPEIYVRVSGGKNFLHVHGDLESINDIAEDGRPVAYLEMHVLPEWFTDEDARKAFRESAPLHIRVPLHQVSQYPED